MTAAGLCKSSTALFVLGLALLLPGMPAAPFEWDELLFGRAVVHFDPAANHPHMPGYPLFVLLCRIVHLVVTDPFRCTQIVSVTATLALLLLTFHLVVRATGSVVSGLATGVLLLCCPCILWYGGTGFSDAAGAALCFGAFVLLLSAGDRRGGHVPFAFGLVAASALGVRAQSLYVLIPMVVFAALWWRPRTVYRLASAAAAGAVLCLAIWIPTLAITGPTRWWKALAWQTAWLHKERVNGLVPPYAPIAALAERWLVSPFGTAWLAALFWTLVIIGTTSLWRSGRQRLVIACAGVGLGSLALSVFSLDLRQGPRYILASLPYLTVLAVGGVGRKAHPWVATISSFMLVVFVAGSLWWTAPGLYLRSSEDPPVWSVLSRLSEELDPTRAVVFIEPRLQPHAEWILGRRGFDVRLIPRRDTQPGNTPEASEITVVRTRGQMPTGPLNAAHWHSEQVESMTLGRYLSCWAVTEPVESP